MKWFFACVLAAVLIVPLWYLYTNQRQQEVQPPLAHEQLPHPGSGQRLVLIDELAELPPRRDPAQAQALSEQAPLIAEPANNQEEMIKQQPASKPSVAAAQACFRLQGFESAQAIQRARKILERRGAQVIRQGEQPIGNVNYWVFLAPAATQTEALQALHQLQHLGVKDVYLLRSGLKANAISLGVFSSESTARQRVREIQALKLQPQIEPLDKSRVQSWLEFTLPANSAQEKELAQEFKGLLLRPCN